MRRRVAGQADTPYGASIALESWFRRTGGFITTSPSARRRPAAPRVRHAHEGQVLPALRGRDGRMLRMLGIPARVAVGFTSGSPDDGEWVVTDHDAHAWVEVWFAGIGWVAFDPTPGRGTLGGEYVRVRLGGGGRGAPARRAPPDDARANAAPDAGRGDLPGGRLVRRERGAVALVGVELVLAAAWILLLGLGKAAMRRALPLLAIQTARNGEPARAEDFLRDQGADVPQTATLATLQRAVYEELGLDARRFATAAACALRAARCGCYRGVARATRGAAHHPCRPGRLSVWARARGLVSLRSLRTAGGS